VRSAAASRCRRTSLARRSAVLIERMNES
jgi:hypothetical protein